MRARWLPLLWVSVGLVGCGASAPEGEALESSVAPIAGGALDLDHPEVFLEYVRWGDGHISSCTATLIAPNLLLTARHCIAAGNTMNVICGQATLGDAVSGGSVAFTNDAVPARRSQLFRGADVRVPSGGQDTCGYDVALVIIDANVPADIALPAVPRIDREATPGEPYTAIGYGVNADGELTEGRMLLGDLQVRCTADACDRRYQVVPNEFMGETGICSGDSGGPALDADGKVIGVVSRGSDPCETPVYGSVASFRDFIVETAFDAARVGGYAPPFWAFSGASDLDETLAGEGDACAESGACRPGFVCYYESDPADASCRAICANDDQCIAGDECVEGFDVLLGGLCLPPAEPAPADGPEGTDEPNDLGHSADEGCSLSDSPVPGPSAPWLLAGALGLGYAVRTRRRRRQP